jgi:hypothetical protein
MHRVVHSSKILGYFHIQHHKVINSKETKWHWNNVLLYNDDIKSTIDLWITDVIPTLIFCYFTGQWWIFFVYYFFQSQAGLQMLGAYIQQSLLELNSYKEVIVSQEGGEYYNSLHAGIKSIDAYSIAKDDFSQKIALGFLPNLLISLYYKK